MNYSYQISAAKTVFKMSASGDYRAVVLAAAPNAGKSTIIIHILNMFFEQYPNYKIVILTHNQKVLAEQMLEGFEAGFVNPNFTYGAFGSGAQVQVGIPAASSKITEMDVMVVDEAHHYFGAKMIEEITQKFTPKHQILMTGSPGIYNSANQNSSKPIYGMHYISGEELVDNDVYSNVVVDIAESNSVNVIEQYKAMYAKLTSDSRFNASKLMIACKTVDDAYSLSIYLKTQGRKVAVSTAASDSENVQIKRFKTGEADTLLVVNKGILGFSDNNVTALIDLKCSKDIDARNQLFARVLRKHPNGVKKFYISVAKSSKYNHEVTFLRSVMELMNKNTFQTYKN